MTRLFTLLLLSFLGTCVRAQLPAMKALSESPRNPSNSIFCLTPDEKLLVISPDRRNTLFIYPSDLSGKPDQLSLKFPERQKNKTAATLMQVSPEGYYVVVSTPEKSKNKTTYISWFDPENGSLVADTVLGTGLTTMALLPASSGNLSIVWNERSGAWIQQIRLTRDSMAYPIQLRATPKQQLSTEPIVAHCRAPGNRWAGIFGNNGGPYNFANFTEAGRNSKYFSIREGGPNMRMIYHPQRDEYLLGVRKQNPNDGTNERLALSWFSLSSTGAVKSPRSINPIVKEGILFDELILLENDKVLIAGAEGKDVAHIWSSILAPNDGALKIYDTEVNHNVEQLFSLNLSRVMAIGADRSVKPEKLIGRTFFQQRGPQEIPAIRFYTPTLFDHQGDTVLDAREAATLEIPWRSVTDLRGPISAKVDILRDNAPIATLANMHTPFLLGRDSGLLQIPLRAGAALVTGSYPIRISLEHNGRAAGEINYLLRTRGLPQPHLVFYPEPMADVNRTIVRDVDTVTVTVTIRNIGRGTAKNVRLSTPFIPHVAVAPENYQILIDSIPPDSSFSTIFKFNPRSYFQHAELPMNFFLLTGNTGQTAYTAVLRNLDSLYLIKDGNTAFVPFSVRNALKKLRGGPSMYSVVSEGPTIEFLCPTPKENLNIISPLRHAPLRIRFTSPKDLGKDATEIAKHISISHKGLPADFCFSTFITYKSGSIVDADHVYELHAEVTVPEKGTHTYEVQIGNIKDTFEVTRSSHTIKKYLHVITVGIPYNDASFTVPSALKVYNTLEHMDGKTGLRFFDGVRLHPAMIDTFQTTPDALKAIVNTVKADIVLDQGGRDKKHVQHYFMMYLVGHGELVAGDLKIKAAHHNGEVFVYNDIVKPLASTPCQKFFIFDACHSGQPAENIPNFLEQETTFDKDFAVRVLGATRGLSQLATGQTFTRFTTELLNTLSEANGLGMLTSEFISSNTISTIEQQLQDKPNTEDYLPVTNSSSNCGRAVFYDYFLEVKLPKDCMIRFDR